MSKNKLKKFDEMSRFANVYQYPFAVLQTSNGCPLKNRWRQDVFKNNNPVVLELGCGRGEYTVGLGRLFPDKNFIGIDIKGARMWAGAKEALETDMKNVAFLRTDIELLTCFFAPNEVSEIWLTFPDPQMKKTNKRLTGTRFMKLYQQFLENDGAVHLKTDSNFLFLYTRAMLDLNGYPLHVVTDDLYASGMANEILSIRTYYEQQWLDRGLKIKYIRFCCRQRHDNEFVEPDIDIEHDGYKSFNRIKN
ncbi:MAG: tRNA (guanosine(46)-N7)-methyltransferase TrmB [Tannerella sp.]|jgi:tRNA (guanine-N7-)-methyltransferase|nr:tRNA (guanosine(46)-N7)-methyltransferase TrmB [Tannerella sp.]